MSQQTLWAMPPHLEQYRQYFNVPPGYTLEQLMTATIVDNPDPNLWYNAISAAGKMGMLSSLCDAHLLSPSFPLFEMQDAMKKHALEIVLWLSENGLIAKAITKEDVASLYVSFLTSRAPSSTT